ncbi:MAG: acyl-homoserine-lactone synthase [Rhodospirillaceae bacterium]
MQASIIEMPDQRSTSTTALEGMFRLRHEVFKERLNWDVGCIAGKERDDFDDLDPVYIVCEEEGEVMGSWRLLPTTGPYMLKNVFPELLHGAPAPEAENTWEISRFAVSKRVAGNDSLGTIRTVTNTLLEELFKFASRRNIERIVAVSDIRFERILKRAGLLTTRFGEPLQIGVTKAVSGYADVSQLNMKRLELTGQKLMSDFTSHALDTHKLAA